jgi:hypothetical protein
MKKEKSLQKLSISDILKKEKITLIDLESLTDEEQRELYRRFNTMYHEAKGTEKDNLLIKADEIIKPQTKNGLWEANHNNIIAFIHNGIVVNNMMPTIVDLMEKTGLSRQTISKHLKEFKEHELYKEHKAQFQILATSVLKKLFHLSMGGNVQASKIFLDAVGETNQNIKANQYIDKQQNNYNSEPQAITGMKIVNIPSDLTLNERLQLLNLTESEIIEYLKNK